MLCVCVCVCVYTHTHIQICICNAPSSTVKGGICLCVRCGAFFDRRCCSSAQSGKDTGDKKHSQKSSAQYIYYSKTLYGMLFRMCTLRGALGFPHSLQSAYTYTLTEPFDLLNPPCSSPAHTSTPPRPPDGHVPGIIASCCSCATAGECVALAMPSASYVWGSPILSTPSCRILSDSPSPPLLPSLFPTPNE